MGKEKPGILINIDPNLSKVEQVIKALQHVVDNTTSDRINSVRLMGINPLKGDKNGRR